jgi:hypothetical protein
MILLISDPDLFYLTLWLIAFIVIQNVFQNRGLTDALERIHYAIPIFHVYGHKGICQVSLCILI